MINDPSTILATPDSIDNSHYMIAEMPDRERPRERLLRLGADALKDSELIAILLRNGRRGCSALTLAEQLLHQAQGDLGKLAKAEVGELSKLPGLGPVKAIELKAAFAIAREGIEGGMRKVLDFLTEGFKNDLQTQYVEQVIKEALDSLSWEDRINFMQGALKRLAPFLPLETLKQSPERLAKHYKPIIRAYVKSLNSINQTLRAM